MILYRLCQKKYAEDMTGQSGMLCNNTWNLYGTPCIYLFENVASCLIESRIYRKTGFLSPEMLVVAYDVPTNSMTVFEREQLLEDGIEHPSQKSCAFGSRVLTAAESLLLAFPSSYLYKRYIYLLNPRHPLIKNVKILRSFYPLRKGNFFV